MTQKRINTRCAALAAVIGGVAALSFSLPADADEDAAKEIGTASTHAGFAAAAKDMNAVQMHLHHTVNCLVGPKGEGFDTSVANPCKDQGNGAIPDTKDSGKLAMLRQGLALVNKGLKETDMAAAQKDATEAQNMIKMGM